VAPAAAAPTRDQAANIASLLASQQRPGQPVQFPQQAPALAPPPAPTMGGAGSPRKNDKGAVTSDDLAALGVPVAAPLPHPPSAGVTPQSPASIAPAAPVPATSGTSATGLHTDTDTSGRSDPPRTALSGGAAVNATGQAGGAGASGQGQTTPTGQGAPMMGMPATGGGATGKVGPPIFKFKGAAGTDQDVMQGRITISEAVRGGTIAQPRDGEAAA
jgi:hypothetical protein